MVFGYSRGFFSRVSGVCIVHMALFRLLVLAPDAEE